MARRTNPIDFTLDPEATKVAREEYPRWRSIVSLTSPIKHRTITEDPRVIRSPHNFHVAIVDLSLRAVRSEDRNAVPAIMRAQIRPDAVTLVSSPRGVASAGANLAPRDRDAEGVYTAFTYLHRLGDVLTGFTEDTSDPVFRGVISVGGHFYDKEGWPFNSFTNPWRPPAGLARAQEALEGLWRVFVLAVGGDLDDPDEVFFWKERVLFPYIMTHVDSKMVREGYAGSEQQPIADLFALAELTTKPLLRPVDLEGIRRLAQANPLYGKFPVGVAEAVAASGRSQEEIIDALNTYGVQFNILWRRWYNALIPALYGTGVMI